jgi:subtilisin-like proprotein convertase family protein
VKVDIDHTYSGDLAIDLIGPSGRKFALRPAKPADSGSGIHETYQVDASGEAANGTWKLQVTDSYRFDVGTLTGWSITF